MSEICMEMEKLISAMLDNEISPAEKQKVLEHLEGCTHCQDFYREQVQYILMLQQNSEITEVPPCPDLETANTRSSGILFYFRVAAAVILIALTFYGGTLFGNRKAFDKIPTYARVAVPAVWGSDKSLPGAEQFSPLQKLIAEYQYRIGEELERDEVDWERIRIMLETLGSLRTDMELVSLHMGYIKAPSGNDSPSRNTWWDLIGDEIKEESL